MCVYIYICVRIYIYIYARDMYEISYEPTIHMSPNLQHSCFDPASISMFRQFVESHESWVDLGGSYTRKWCRVITKLQEKSYIEIPLQCAKWVLVQGFLKASMICKWGNSSTKYSSFNRSMVRCKMGFKTRQHFVLLTSWMVTFHLTIMRRKVST